MRKEKGMRGIVEGRRAMVKWERPPGEGETAKWLCHIGGLGGWIAQSAAGMVCAGYCGRMGNLAGREAGRMRWSWRGVVRLA
jgi:hypothetical protein